MEDLPWLALPQFEFYPEFGSSDQYGARFVAARHAGLQSTPPRFRGSWQHGWVGDHLQFSPHVVATETIPDHDTSVWVARKSEEEYLQAAGYHRARAIGLPIAYLPAASFERLPGSLLVMPVHTLPYMARIMRIEEYVDAIGSLRRQFSEIVACVHPTCLDHGLWLGHFRRLGIPVVPGAVHDDRHALARMQTLLSTFEYMTSNGFGSHLAYAALFGAKPSIHFDCVEMRREDHTNTPFYRNHPELLTTLIEANRPAALRERYPQLFRHPLEAEPLVGWGRDQVGAGNIVQPEELRRLLGWRLRDRISDAARTPVNAGYSALPESVKGRGFFSRQVRRRRQEIRRLREYPRFQATTTDLLGERFEIPDGLSFLKAYERIWRDGLYRFVTTKAEPTIFVAGAGAGVDVLYFKREFPGSRVLAFEADDVVFGMLARNCRVRELQDVDVVHAALGTSSEGSVSGGLPAASVTAPSSAPRAAAPAVRFRSYLERETHIDMLKINIGGAETAVLVDCADLLSKVDNVCVEFHSFFDQPQRLDELLGLFRSAGLRVYLEGDDSSEQPLFVRRVRGGMDLRVSVFAYRP